MIRLMDAISNPNDRAAQNRAGFELEVSAESQRGFGSDFKCRGEFVPDSLLSGKRDLSAGIATDGAELVANNLLAASYIDVLRNAMVTAQAGITILPGLIGNVRFLAKLLALHQRGSALKMVTLPKVKHSLIRSH